MLIIFNEKESFNTITPSTVETIEHQNDYLKIYPNPATHFLLFEGSLE
jgi:hypothetical protein